MYSRACQLHFKYPTTQLNMSGVFGKVNMCYHERKDRVEGKTNEGQGDWVVLTQDFKSIFKI